MIDLCICYWCEQARPAASTWTSEMEMPDRRPEVTPLDGLGFVISIGGVKPLGEYKLCSDCTQLFESEDTGLLTEYALEVMRVMLLDKRTEDTFEMRQVKRRMMNMAKEMEKRLPEFARALIESSTRVMPPGMEPTEEEVGATAGPED